MVKGLEAYEEDEIKEMRSGLLFFRYVGPTVRCNAITANHKSHIRFEDHEPNSTLVKYRNAKGLGTLFGMYY